MLGELCYACAQNFFFPVERGGHVFQFMCVCTVYENIRILNLIAFIRNRLINVLCHSFANKKMTKKIIRKHNNKLLCNIGFMFATWPGHRHNQVRLGHLRSYSIYEYAIAIPTYGIFIYSLLLLY